MSYTKKCGNIGVVKKFLRSILLIIILSLISCDFTQKEDIVNFSYIDFSYSSGRSYTFSIYIKKDGFVYIKRSDRIKICSSKLNKEELKEWNNLILNADKLILDSLYILIDNNVVDNPSKIIEYKLNNIHKTAYIRTENAPNEINLLLDKLIVLANIECKNYIDSNVYFKTESRLIIPPPPPS
jgi:hypothetical protein